MMTLYEENPKLLVSIQNILPLLPFVQFAADLTSYSNILSTLHELNCMLQTNSLNFVNPHKIQHAGHMGFFSRQTPHSYISLLLIFMYTYLYQMHLCWQQQRSCVFRNVTTTRIMFLTTILMERHPLCL